MDGLGGLVPSAIWNVFLAAGPHRPHRPRDVLLREGEAGTRVLVLGAGRVKATRTDADGERHLLALRGPGEVLGEIAILDGEPRSATITAVDPGWTVPIPADHFLRLLHDYDLSDLVVRHGLARLREGERVRAELATLPAGQRLARLLLRFTAVTAEPDRRHLDLDQAELGGAIGLARSTVAAELAVLRGQGIIATGRRGVLVLDPQRLAKMADL